VTPSEQRQLDALIAAAKAEDLGDGDLTSLLMEDGDQPARFELVAKAPGVLSGCEVAAAVLEAYDADAELTWAAGVGDGFAWTKVPQTLGTIRGSLATILAAERVLLNFLQRLSGVATLTRRFVDALAGTDAGLFDTRKTTPGWRFLEKRAVCHGGGRSHRAGLHDAVLIKDNHLADVPTSRLAGHVFNMLNRMGVLPHSPIFVEVEARSVEQVAELLKVVGINIILLDNMTASDIERAVALRDHLGLRGRVELEASGGVTLDNVRAYAQTGVERISVGALTHSAPALDVSLEREQRIANCE